MTLIATALTLGPSAIKAYKVTDSYSIHRVVYSLFADVRTESEKNESTPSGIQFAEIGGDESGRRIVILSNRTPIEGKTLIGATIHTRFIDDSFLSHALYSFKLVANPTRRDSKSRQLIPIKDNDGIRKWLIDKTASLGFDINPITLDVIKIEVDQFLGKSNRPITLEKAHITGQLRVTDREAFMRCFSSGIGRGRAFGCGLLQIVPILDTLLQ